MFFGSQLVTGFLVYTVECVREKGGEGEREGFPTKVTVRFL